MPTSMTVSVSYDKFAKKYDDLDDGVFARSLGFPALRQQLVASATGEILETGVGTGTTSAPLHCLLLGCCALAVAALGHDGVLVVAP